jgi:hypothetical protein
MCPTRNIYGIDFSGAKDAGNKIWIAKGAPDGERLLVSECLRARELTTSGRQLEACLPALVNLVKSEINTIFGFDFPFGIAAPLVKEKTWEDFVLAFPNRYESPGAFREACRKADEGHELKRQTDVDAHSPFSPYNLRLYKQTYYGISKVLFPLIQDSSACVLPFQVPDNNKPWILEICPASSLKHLMGKRAPSYKGSKQFHEENRRQILADMIKAGVSFGKNAEIKRKIIADKGGDRGIYLRVIPKLLLT